MLKLLTLLFPVLLLPLGNLSVKPLFHLNSTNIEIKAIQTYFINIF